MAEDVLTVQEPNTVIGKEPELDDSPGWAFNHSELFGPFRMKDGSIVAIEVHSNRGHEDTSKLMVNVTDKGDLIQLNIGKRLGEEAKKMSDEMLNKMFTAQTIAVTSPLGEVEDW